MAFKKLAFYTDSFGDYQFNSDGNSPAPYSANQWDDKTYRKVGNPPVRNSPRWNLAATIYGMPQYTGGSYINKQRGGQSLVYTFFGLIQNTSSLLLGGHNMENHIKSHDANAVVVHLGANGTAGYDPADPVNGDAPKWKAIGKACAASGKKLFIIEAPRIDSYFSSNPSYADYVAGAAAEQARRVAAVNAINAVNPGTAYLIRYHSSGELDFGAYSPYTVDGLHPNPETYTWIAHNVGNKIAAIMGW